MLNSPPGIQTIPAGAVSEGSCLSTNVVLNSLPPPCMNNVLSATVNPFGVQEMAASVLASVSSSFALLFAPLLLQAVKTIVHSIAQELIRIRLVDGFII